MSNFWAEKLGVRQPSPQPQYVSQQRPWWDSRPAPPVPQQQQYQNPQHPQTVPTQPQMYAPRQAKSLGETGSCPECGSDSYFTVKPEMSASVLFGHARSRCTSCGYPYRQTGSMGLGVATSGTQASRQPHDGSSQVIPGFIAKIESVS